MRHASTKSCSLMLCSESALNNRRTAFFFGVEKRRQLGKYRDFSGLNDYGGCGQVVGRSAALLSYVRPDQTPPSFRPCRTVRWCKGFVEMTVERRGGGHRATVIP